MHTALRLAPLNFYTKKAQKFIIRIEAIRKRENDGRGLLWTQLLHIQIVNTKNFGCIKDSSRQRKGTMPLLPMEVEDLIKSSRAVNSIAVS